MNPIKIECSTKHEWLLERKRGIGASEAAAILGLNPWCSALDLYLQKKGLSEVQENLAMRVGTILEPLICDEFTRQTEYQLKDHGQYTIYQHENIPFLRCTLDREILPKNGEGPGALEVKSTSAFNKSAWQDDEGEPEAPLHYRVQNQLQMAVMGWSWGSIAALIGNHEFLHVRQEINPEFIDHLVEKCSEFWDRVQKGIPPEPDGSEACAQALKKLYPQEDYEVVELPPESLEWHTSLTIIKQDIKSLESEKRLFENKFRAAIGEAAIGKIPGSGIQYSLKTTQKAEYTCPATSYRTLRVKGK